MSQFGSVLSSLAVLFAMSAIGAGALSAYGRHLRGLADQTRAHVRLRRTLRAGYVVMYVTTLFAMTAADWLAVVDRWSGSLDIDGTVVGSAFLLALGFGPPLVAVVATYLGGVPAMTDIRSLDMDATTAVWRFVRHMGGAVAAFFATVISFLAVLAFGLQYVNLPVFALAFVAVVGIVTVLGIYAGSPLLIRIMSPTRRPREDERRRLRTLCADVKFDPRAIRIIESNDETDLNAFLRGAPGLRTLFVSDALLSTADDDRLRALLGVWAGRARSYHFEIRLLLVLGTFVGPLTILFDIVPFGGVPIAIAIFVVSLLSLWVGRRLVFRADAFAADRAGTENVIELLEWICDVTNRPLERGRLWSLRRMAPSPATRIDHLLEHENTE